MLGTQHRTTSIPIWAVSTTVQMGWKSLLVAGQVLRSMPGGDRAADILLDTLFGYGEPFDYVSRTTPTDNFQ